MTENKPMNYDQQIAAQIKAAPRQVAATVALLDEGNTLPFIARYRKEVTGGLDEEQIRVISEQLEFLRGLDERRQTILASIQEQGKLTPELNEQILAATTRTALEDLYLPYKPHRRTRADIAREKGLQGLADLIFKQPVTRVSLDEIARPFLNEQVATVEDGLAGARDIVAETISDRAEVRQLTREKAMKYGAVKTALIEGAGDPKRVYEIYYDFETRVDLLRPHQVLAMNRGEEEKILRVRVAVPERYWREAVAMSFTSNPRSVLAEQMNAAVQDAADRLLLPAIERDVRRALTETAEKHAISVFAANLRALLSQPPLAGYTVLGIDPGFRTGCKVVVVHRFIFCH